MQNNEQNERVRPKLESAADLKGKKANGAKNGKNIRARWIATLVSLVLVLGVVIGAYYTVMSLRPEEEEEENPLNAIQNNTVKMIEGRVNTDVATVTIYQDGVEQYTLVSHLKEKAEAEAAAKAAEEAAQASEGASDVLAPAEETEEDPAVQLPDYEIKDMPWFTVNADKGKNLINYSYSMVATRIIEENAEDLSAYGLDRPRTQAVFTYHDGTSLTLNVGDKVAAGSFYYFRLDDSNDVYMSSQNIYKYHSMSLEELHQMPTLATFDPENTVVNHVLVEQEGKEPIEMEMRNSTGNTISISAIKLVQPFLYDANADRSTELEVSIGSIALSGYAGHYETEEEKAAFGLDAPMAYIEMDDDNGRVEFTVGSYVSGSDTLRYVAIDDSGDVYTVDASLLSFLNECRVTYLVDQFANLVYIKRINGFTIDTPETSYTARVERVEREDDSGETKTYEIFYFEDELADTEIFRDFYQELIGTLFDKRIEDESEYHFDGPVACTVTYDLNYTDEPFVVEYLDYDRDYYAIRRDGVSLFLIRKEKVNSMLSIAEDYRNGIYDGAHDTFEY